MASFTKITSLLLLIQSLSKAEKRYFRLQSNLQEGDKAYLFFFDLLEKSESAEDVYAAFCRQYTAQSYEPTAKHLYKSIMDCLLKLREKEDIQTEICNLISKAGILFERELFDEAFAELNRAKRLAADFENDPLLLLIRRTELKYLAAIDFKGINERELVSKQMKISELMKYSRNLNQHTQLYDILKYRLTHKGYARSDKQREDLNDLVLSELHLIANSTYRGFEAQKLHLLFQATYYLNSGNYKSAIRFYKELLLLFEENRRLILNPPIYYLSAIRGILDSLHVAALYNEMPFFIAKLEEITAGDYTTEFILRVKALVFHYKVACLTGEKEYETAASLLENAEESLFRKSHLLRLEDQLNIYLDAVVICLYRKDIRQAKKNMKRISASGKLFSALPAYRTARLVNLLLQAELGNYSFIPNEIASIRRTYRDEKPIYHTEKLIFWFVQNCPLPFYQPFRQRFYRQFLKKKEALSAAKYERQLLKTFDFPAWIESKLSKATD